MSSFDALNGKSQFVKCCDPFGTPYRRIKTSTSQVEIYFPSFALEMMKILTDDVNKAASEVQHLLKQRHISPRGKHS